MACQINRNKEGEIESVLRPSGAQSALFHKISSHPLIQNSEEALGVYMGVYSDKLGGNEEVVTFVNKSGGQIYNTYLDALKNTEENGEIEVGFEKDGEFFPILKTDRSTNKNTQNGFINKSILDGKIQDTKKRVGNKFKFQAGGRSEIFQAINTEIVNEEAIQYLGTGGVGKDGSTFDLIKTNDKVRLRDKEGKVQYVESEYFNTESFDKIKREWGLDAAVGAVVGREWVTHLNNNTEKPLTEGPKRTERQLQLLLMRTLENMGVKTMSILEYTENYRKRKGVEPSAKALSDIANQIVALKDGTIDTDALLEETAHFINEAMPQEEVENLLRNIHRTEEWIEFSEQYRAIYAREYQTAEDVEQAVRREVLGKVLANSLRTRFEITPQTTEARANIVEYLRESINRFLSRVENFFRQEFQRDLDSYTDQVESMIFEQTLGTQMDTSQFKDNKFVLYQVEPSTGAVGATEKIRRNSVLMINSIRGQIHRAYAAEGTSTAIDRTRLNRLEEQLETENFKNSIGGLINITKGYLERIEATLKKDGKTPLSSEQRTIYHTIKDQLSPALSEIGVLLEKTDIPRKDAQRFKEDIADIGRRTTEITSRSSNYMEEAIMALTQRVMDRHNMPEEYREHVKKWVDLAETDTTFFHANFGQISHSKDPLLGLMGVLAKDMAMEENLATINSVNTALNKLRELGYDHRVFSQFLDKNSGMILSEVDYSAFEKAKDENYLRILNEYVTDKSIFTKVDLRGNKVALTEQEILERRQALESLLEEGELGAEGLADMRSEIAEANRELVERTMEEAYYKELQKNMDDSKISPYGKRFINAYYRDLSSYNRKALKDGIVDLTNLGEADKVGYEDLKMSRTRAKSYYDESGMLKKGLEKVDGEIVAREDIEPGSPAQLAIDLHTFDSGFSRDVEAFQENFFKENKRYPTSIEVAEFQERNKTEIEPVFWSRLQEAFERSAEEGLEFLKMNAHTNFSAEFWESLGANASLTDRIKGKIVELRKTDVEKAEALEQTLEVIERDGTAMREILRQHRRSNNPSEIATELMSRTAMQEVRALQNSLSEAYRAANLVLDKAERVEGGIETSNKVNEAYLKILDDMGLTEMTEENLEEEFSFARDHMTEENETAVVNAIDFINRVVRRGQRNLKPNSIVKRTLEERFPSLSLETLNREEAIAVKRVIIRDRLLPYYRRFSPESYEVYRNILSASDTSANAVQRKVNLVRDGMGGQITITPIRSFLKGSEDSRRNPKFINNYYGGIEQPKRNLFKNAEFERMFGEITYENPDDYLSGRSSKNQNLYEAYKVMLEMNKEGLDAMGVKEGFNYFTAPQIRKGTIQRFVDLTKNINGRSIKEAYENLLTFTPDEMVKGETNFGDTIKVIPMQYIRKLQNIEDISTDLFYSIAARNAEGFKRQTRLKHYGDIMALSDTISRRETGNGKDVKATNTYKMMESFRDYSLFGIKETWSYEIDTKIFGKIDLAKVLRKLVSYVKFKNLGLNVIIPITSALTTKVQMSIERAVGEHVDSSSVRRARKEMPKLLTEAMKDFNTIGKTSELAVMGQYWRVFDIGETLKNSSYGGIARILPKLGMGLHGLSNFPLYGEAMLTVLHDYRVVDGTLMNKRDFVRAEKKANSGATRAQINTKWRSFQDNNFRDFMSVENGELIFDKEGLRDIIRNEEGYKMDKEAFEEYFENKIKGIQTRMGEVVLNIDTQIPMETRVAAQRSALWSIFLTHKSFLITNISRRTRGEFWNPMTGEQEAGTYSSNLNFIGTALAEMRRKGSKNIVKEFSQQWKEASPEERMNLRRTAVDMTILTMMGILAYLLFGMADDDEYADNYTVQAAAYFYQRLMNETSSMQAVGSVTTLNETISSPIVGMQIVEGIFEANKLFSGEEITQGTFKGHTERYRYLSKMSPAISNYNYLKDAKSLQQARKNYRLFNAGTIDANAFTYMANKFDD